MDYFKDFVSDFTQVFKNVMNDGEFVTVAIDIYKNGYAIHSIDDEGKYFQLIEIEIATGTPVLKKVEFNYL